MSANDHIEQYLSNIQRCESETAVRETVRSLLERLFPGKRKEISELALGAETSGKGGRRIDTEFGSLLIEYKFNLSKDEESACDQLKQHLADIWSKSRKTESNFRCLATDGKNWCLYTPIINVRESNNLEIKKENIDLKKNEEIDIFKTEYQTFYKWLDRIFFRENQLKLTSETICADFGVTSHNYINLSKKLSECFDNAKQMYEVREAYENWNNCLQYTYGEIKLSYDLFIKHTYLSGLTKILMAIFIASKKNKTFSPKDIPLALNGKYFYELNVRNYVEKDFFYWINFEQVSEFALHIWNNIFNQLNTYDFSTIDQDFLKDMYQGLIDPENRHDLGEYYTPDWLCEKIVKQSLTKFKLGTSKVADITCGSGSFLRVAIRYLISQNNKNNTKDLAYRISKSVIGFEIHPLAVFIAKTNYMLALEGFIKVLPKPLTLPIYLCDSLLSGKFDKDDLINKEFIQIECFGKVVSFPRVKILMNEGFDEIVDFIESNLNTPKNEIRKLVSGFVKKYKMTDESKREVFIDSVVKLANIVYEKYRNTDSTTWSYVLKNNYRPIFFSQKFDVIVGNPPWLSFRYIKSEDYRKELETLGLEKYKIAPNSDKLRTQMELATIFLAHGVDYYLKDKGKLYFVLPRSLFSADHHSEFRESKFNLPMKVNSIWDLGKVKPLFNVPSCVIFVGKESKTQTFDEISGVEFSGKLPYQNCNLSVASHSLKEKNVNYNLIKLNKRTALSDRDIGCVGQDFFYVKKFKQGATIVPRNFYFVESHDFEHEKSIYNIKTNVAKTKEAKEPYKSVHLEGRANQEFIFKSLIAENVLPFSIIDPFYVHLPVVEDNGVWRYISPSEMKQKGFIDSSNWFGEVEKYYNKLTPTNRKETFFEWVNYNNKLLAQNPKSKYWVVYNTSGKNVCASVLENKWLVWIDSKLYWHVPAKGKDEAYYLAGVLNSGSLNEIIKPFQSVGLLGQRDIHKKILEVGIPRFDQKNELHKNIAQIAIELTNCSNKFASTLTDKNTGKKRSKVREEFSSEFKKLDNTVINLFKSEN